RSSQLGHDGLLDIIAVNAQEELQTVARPEFARDLIRIENEDIARSGQNGSKRAVHTAFTIEQELEGIIRCYVGFGDPETVGAIQIHPMQRDAADRTFVMREIAKGRCASDVEL